MRTRIQARALVAAVCLFVAPPRGVGADSPLPPRPTLPDDATERVTALGAKIDVLREAFLRNEIGSLDEAIALAEQVLAIRLEHQGPNSTAGSQWTDARGNRAEWYEVADARRAVANLGVEAALPAADRAELALLPELNEQIGQAYEEGRYADCLAGIERDLELRGRILGAEHPDTLVKLGDAGTLLSAQGRLAEAEARQRDALAGLRRALGNEHPSTLTSVNNLGEVLEAQGRLTEAEACWAEALAMRRRLLGDEDPATLRSISNMGSVLSSEGRLIETEPYYREVLEARRRLFGDDHPSTLTSAGNMGWLLAVEGRLAEAEPYFRLTLAGSRRVLGDDHPDTLQSVANVGGLLDSLGRPAEAEPYYREAIEGFRRTLGDEHPLTLFTLHAIGTTLVRQGRLAEAEPYFAEALETRRRVLGNESPQTLASINGMGWLLALQGRRDEAEPYCREAVETGRRVLGGGHPDTLTSINVLGALLTAQGRFDEAEPYLREALEGRRRVLGDDHPDTLTSIDNLARLLAAQGRFAEAEPSYREALGLAERLRTAVIGQERERAAYAAYIGIADTAADYAAVLASLDRGAEAFGVVERGRGRALLDLLDRSSVDVVEEARRRAGGAALESAVAAEEQARAVEAEATAQLASLRRERGVQEQREGLTGRERAELLASYDRRIDAQLGRVAATRQATFEAGAAVLAELQGLVPVARPLADRQIVEALDDDELILSYAWTPDHVLLMTASRAGGTGAVVLAAGRDAVASLHEEVSRLREAVAGRPVGPWSDGDARAVLAAVLPDAVRGRVERAKRLVVLPDGPLNDVPFDLLLETDAALAPGSVVYAASASMYINRRTLAARLDRAGTPTAVVLGDPVFDREAPPDPEYPPAGVLLAMVQEGSNAAEGGLARGDVLLRYAGSAVADFGALRDEIARVSDEVASGARPAGERFAVTYWRGGGERETTLAPGRLGIAPDQRDPASGLRAMARAARGSDTLDAEASSMDQVRLHGGSLRRLSGTRREAEQITGTLAAAGGRARSLLGEDATIGNLESAVEGCRYVHLATHGLTGSALRPYDASLALTQPEVPAPDDIGFLTLDHLIRAWRGRLASCDLVVLSACDTQRGVRQGDSVMALPWGFFFAGAPTVIASLWQVDDTATALLMGRLYENLLQRRMTKEEALVEAKRWLRSLTEEQASELETGIPASARGAVRPSAPIKPAAARPYEHPYFWAAFVLIGSPSH